MSETALISATRVNAFVSPVYVWCRDSNTGMAQVNIPITTNLRGDGYVEISTTNTNLDPQSIINILLFEGDTI